jgi:magnesium transporter
VTTRILVLGQGDALPSEGSRDALPELLADPSKIVWVDIEDPGEGERKMLEEVFRLHPTSVEDLLADAPTPKIEYFASYIYVVWHALLPGWEKQKDFQICDLDLLIGSNFLLTSHNSRLPSVDHAFDTAKSKRDAMRRGPAYCAYLIADVLTERFLPLMEQIEHDIDTLETAIVKNPGPHLLETIFLLKDKLQRLRRLGVHQREVLNRMSRGSDRDADIIAEEVRPFFRDAYDNFVRVVDLNDSFREIVNSSMDAYLSMQGHKLNEIMKVLTLISTIMLPLTFIAGLYGMNFEDMPELHWRYGYFAAIAVMLVTAILFVWYFKRKGWL